MVYCVEDDAAIRELLVYTLRNTGYEAQGFVSGESFFQALQKRLPDLILLDVMLPGEDGVSILKRLRAAPETRALPVILVTARGSEFDKVTGLDSGADDYITKPFGMMELLSRVRAALRRTGPSAPPETLEAGRITMDTLRHTVQADGVAVALTRREYDLLETLIRSGGAVLTRDRLLSEIWGYGFGGETRTVDVHIRSLRQKLGDAAALIETVRGVGYRMGEVPR
ncbi:MAG TPA: response regulator transcription factor [Oscillospiraceae bacterium]|nr:response regulator transcription factor [Oscillospiraceae bacterium]HPE15462.1 response regulator transcription factor [Oscillospiraceae bacterium]